MTIKKAVGLLLSNKGMLVGSRAFGVANGYSDYDIVILEKDFQKIEHDELLMQINMLEVDIKSYMHALPLGNSRLLRGPSLDIIVLESEKDMDIMKDVVAAMRRAPILFTKNKDLRCQMFEHALISMGYKDQIEWARPCS